jgi:CheY-like chemotaxis protein
MKLKKLIYVFTVNTLILFLENKGYDVTTKSNGFDAIEYVKDNVVDVVLMDESMPGLTGLQTLQQIKEIKTNLPVVLITKNEAENLMDEAIGSQISDYLIKPVNPNQVWLSLKKIIDNKRLVAEKTTSSYQQQFTSLFGALNSNPNYNEWMDLYKKLVYWELEMKKSDSPEMQEVFASQKQEANTEFFKFVGKNYDSWVNPKTIDAPIMSNSLMKYKVFPHLEKGTPLFFVLIDNLRFDQWKTIQPIFAESFRIHEEETFYAILPTATQYARNAIFAGMMPIDIEKQFVNPDLIKLNQLATQTKGQVVFPDKVDYLIKSLLENEDYKSVQKTIIKKIPLIDSIWLLILIIICLATEWFVRKYNGML